MPIGIEGCIPLSINISIIEFLINEDDTYSPPINVITAISVPLPPSPPTTPVPIPKLAMNPEEEQAFISKLLNNPSTFPPEVSVKEKIGKLVLMWPRNYALDHPAIPLLFEYTQHGCPVDCGKDCTLEKIILVLKQGPHVPSKESEATR